MIERCMALRITAIRETFEESGVLLLQGGGEIELEAREVAEWRTKVHKEPGQLLELCR